MGAGNAMDFIHFILIDTTLRVMLESIFRSNSPDVQLEANFSSKASSQILATNPPFSVNASIGTLILLYTGIVAMEEALRGEKIGFVLAENASMVTTSNLRVPRVLSALEHAIAQSVDVET